MKSREIKQHMKLCVRVPVANAEPTYMFCSCLLCTVSYATSCSGVVYSTRFIPELANIDGPIS